MTTACERFELEIGMQQHGALDVEEEAKLRAHLATCATCRAFAHGSDALAAEAQREAAGVDWSRVMGGMKRLQRARHIKLWIAPLFLLQAPLSYWLASGQRPPVELVACAPVTVLLYLGYLWLVNRPFVALVRAGRSGGDLVQGYLAELRRQLLRTRIFAAATALFTAGALIGAAVETEPRIRLVELGAAVIYGAWMLWELRTAKRLRAALAEGAS